MYRCIRKWREIEDSSRKKRGEPRRAESIRAQSDLAGGPVFSQRSRVCSAPVPREVRGLEEF